MPQSTAQNVSLSPGDKVAVLNAETLAAGASTQAVALIPVGGDAVPLALVNQTDQTLTLEASADYGATWVPVYDDDEQAVTAAASTVQMTKVSPSLLYHLKNGSMSAITSKTAYLAR